MATAERVPVDERWLGLDKRGFPPAIVAVVLLALLVWVVPAIDRSVAWDNPTVAGDVLNLGGGVTITPPVDWQLERGLRVTDPPINPAGPGDASGVELANGGTTITIASSGWTGSANDLLDQYNKVREGSDLDADRLFTPSAERSSVTTGAGKVGVSESFTSAQGDGVTYAFVVPTADGDPVGIVITVTATGEPIDGNRDQIDDLISSLATSESAS